ncbi:MAG: YkgJ family cysteine cluster protein [Candidatus Bathyarchaeia archaeon]
MSEGKTCSFNVCSQCKLNCCVDANPPLTAARQRTILEYLREQDLNIPAPFVQEAYLHAAADEEGYCVFHERQTGRCLIHPIKPETCKAGPVTFDINPQTGKIEWFLKNNEICRLAQELRGDDERFSAHFSIAKTELLRLTSELDSEALKSILKIEEPQTSKIGENQLSEAMLHKLGIR